MLRYYEKGITLSGGGALIMGLDRLLSESLKIPIYVVDDPLSVVARRLRSCASKTLKILKMY